MTVIGIGLGLKLKILESVQKNFLGTANFTFIWLAQKN